MPSATILYASHRTVSRALGGNVRIVGSARDNDHLGEGIVADATRSFRDYFYVLTLTALPVAILVAITAALLSVPLAFTIGLVTFIFAYIPYLGALLSGVFAVTIAFGSGGLVPAVGIVVAIAIGLEPGDIVGQLIKLGNGGVEAEAFDAVRHTGNGLVGCTAQRDCIV